MLTKITQSIRQKSSKSLYQFKHVQLIEWFLRRCNVEIYELNTASYSSQSFLGCFYASVEYRYQFIAFSYCNFNLCFFKT